MGVTAPYNRAKFNVGEGGLTFDTADLRVLLVRSTYVFSPTHNTVADVAPGNEFGGTGYLRKQLANKTYVEDDVLNLARFDADDLVWTGANFSIGGVFNIPIDAAIIYVEGLTDDQRQLISSFDIIPKSATSGSNYTLQWGAAGILVLI